MGDDISIDRNLWSLQILDGRDDYQVSSEAFVATFPVQ